MKISTLLLLFPVLLNAQHSAFLKDPDIVWATEVTQDWVVDLPTFDAELEIGITTIKLLRTERNAGFWNMPYLTELVFQAVRSGHLAVYLDEACAQPAFPEQVLYSQDTILTFDLETYEEKKQVVQNEWCPHAWRLKQVLAYHRKPALWSTRVEAIAPLGVIRNMSGDSIGIKPLFWFKPANKRPRIRTKGLVWAKKILGRQDGATVPVTSARPVKVSVGYQNPVPHFLEVMKNDYRKPFYDNWNERLLTPAERSGMLSRADTVIVYDPETYQETAAIVRNDLNINNIRELRLLQSWYWDERRSCLYICLDAIAPLLDVFDHEGNFRYKRPLFYRRTKK
ncbi:MAG: hypothetical protein H6575_09625 [Lewinellaceae bacterium]|nr:hypothetical protein [Lewinellaceae bacterium]